MAPAWRSHAKNHPAKPRTGHHTSDNYPRRANPSPKSTATGSLHSQTCHKISDGEKCGLGGAENGKKTLTIPKEEVIAAKPTAEWDAKVTGATAMTADRFVGQLYQELQAGR